MSLWLSKTAFISFSVKDGPKYADKVLGKLGLFQFFTNKAAPRDKPESDGADGK